MSREPMIPGLARKPNPFATLRRLARPAAEATRCEFCSLPLALTHRHVLETNPRKILCACDACALRFENVAGRYHLIPRDTRPLPGFQMTDAQWDALALPIQLAFILHSSPAERTLALYPSPAGATESLLALSAWDALTADNPVLASMQPDVEALLINRLNGAREYYLAPIDVCFELVGLVRVHWRGFSGGEKVWQEVKDFFARFQAAPQLTPVTEAAHA